jgi:flagellar motility protein MotE (MotC chaperone)
MNWTKRIRLLPVLVAVAFLMLAIRLGDLGSAVAQNQTPPPAPAARAPQAPSPRPVQLAQAPAAPQAPAAAPAAAPAQPAPAGDGTFSPGEMEALQDLVKRREELEKRQTELEQREAILQAAERRIQQQVEELKGLQAQIDTAIKKYDEGEQAKRTSLVRLFQNMKPAEAAKIFEQMELPILLEIVEAMNERRAAPILAQMNPVRAQQVTAELARRRQPEAQPSRIPAARQG